MSSTFVFIFLNFLTFTKCITFTEFTESSKLAIGSTARVILTDDSTRKFNVEDSVVLNAILRTRNVVWTLAPSSDGIHPKLYHYLSQVKLIIDPKSLIPPSYIYFQRRFDVLLLPASCDYDALWRENKVTHI